MLRKLLVLSVALGLALPACAEQTIKTGPESDATSEIGGGASNDGGSEKAGVGDAVTLAGNDEELQVMVRVMRVVDPAKPENRFFGPDKGNRFVALQLRLTNVGSAVYSDSPSNGAVLIDADDQQFEASIFDAVEPALGSPKIAPGDSRVGYITFELPKSARPATFQFTLDSGFGPETGEWAL